MDIILLAVAAALCCLAPLIIVGLIRDRSGNSTVEQQKRQE